MCLDVCYLALLLTKHDDQQRVIAPMRANCFCLTAESDGQVMSESMLPAAVCVQTIISYLAS